MEQLKSSDPSAYDDLDYEAQSELLYLYIKLGHSFKPFVISEFQERLLARRPQDSRMKFTLALTLRRYNQRDYASAYPNVDFTKGLSRAADLLVEIKNDPTNSLDLRGKAAAELGEIVFQDKNEKKRLGLGPRTCYEEAIRLAPDNPPVLNRAGKFFRFEKDLNKSQELLERAISVTLHPTAHHQLGLTYKEMALQQASAYGHHGPQMRRGASRGSWGRGANQHRGGNWTSPAVLRRDDRSVQQAIWHFRKALEIHHEDNKGVLQDLGLILLEVGDYNEALKQFVVIAEAWPVQIYHVYQAFENAGKALQAISRSLDDLSYRETSVICFTLGLTIQCLSFLSEIESCATTLNPSIWFSLGDLATVMSKGKNFFQTIKQCRKQEKILLNCLMNQWSTLPALTTLSRLCNIQLADRVEPVLKEIEDFQARGDFSGALLLRSLLNMTLKNDGRFGITHDYVRGLLETAQWLANLHDRQRQSGSGDGDDNLNAIVSRTTLAASHVLCRHAFQDAVSWLKNSASDEANSGNSRRALVGDLGLSGASEPDLEEAAGDEDVYSGNLHVLFLHDPQDQEAERDVSAMERLLEDVCGLKMSRHCGSAEVSRGEAEMMMERVCDQHHAVDDSAELRVFVVRSEGISSEYTSLIQKLTKAGNSSHDGAAAFPSSPPLRPCHVLLLDAAPLPEMLNGHRLVSTWTVPPEVKVSLSGSRSRPNRRDVEAAHSLFYRLFGLTEAN